MKTEYTVTLVLCLMAFLLWLWIKRMPLNHPVYVFWNRIWYWFKYESRRYLRTQKEVPFDFVLHPEKPKKNHLAKLKKSIGYLFGYRPRSYMPNPILSLWGLSLLMKANPFPIEISIGNEGIYLIKHAWHGLRFEIEFHALRNIRSISMKVFLGHFTEISITVLSDRGGTIALKTRNWFFSPTNADVFFSEYTRLTGIQNFN